MGDAASTSIADAYRADFHIDFAWGSIEGAYLAGSFAGP